MENKHFGEWEVLRYDGNHRWICKCSCGTVRSVLEKTLKSGTSKSCGHNTNKFEDLTGKHFGELEVLSYLGKHNSSMWLCKCSCGKLVQVEKARLKSNPEISCGHVRLDKLRLRNSESREKLEGRTIGEWLVGEYVGDRKYRCTCSCGKVKIVSQNSLIRGTSNSCGHNNGKSLIRDISEQQFGELTAKKYIGNKKWLCKCSCGNTTEVHKGNLLNGSVTSCGCKQYDRVSKEELEEVIDKYTIENGQAPFIADVSKLINRHDAHTRSYIQRYKLENKINKTFDSKAESEIYKMFTNDNNVILHDRKILKGKELDILINDKRIAIEYNGSFWHSDIFKDTMYHQEKTFECAKLAIQLIHIFEYEWEDDITRAKIIDYLNSKIYSKNKVIQGRKTTIQQITREQANDFCKENHLQNESNSAINIGCIYDNELIGVITLGSPRFNNDYEYEIHRLCWKRGVIVTGGTEKMFKYFMHKYKPSSVLTYVDISKFTGNVYTRLGFEPIGFTKPGYVWVNTASNKVLSRHQCQKHKLIEQGLGSVNDTEDSIMVRLGYLKIYNSGNLKLLWKEGSN